MPGSPSNNQADWFEEFKKLNSAPAPSSAAAPPTPPGGSSKASNRRRHPRFEIDDAQATLTREGMLSVFGVGKSNRAREALDLSEGGVRFLTTERLPIGTKVRIIIQMDKYKDAVEASGEVRWSYQSAKRPEDFFAGVQFVNTDAAHSRKIALMREWFTSSQYRAVRETKAKQRRGNDFIFPK